MATNKDFVGYDGKAKPGAGRQIPAKAQHEGAGGNSADHSRMLTHNGTQEDDATNERSTDAIGSASSSVLGGLAGVKRAAVATKASGSQNLFAGLAGSSSPAEKKWSRNSGSRNGY